MGLSILKSRFMEIVNVIRNTVSVLDSGIKNFWESTPRTGHYDETGNFRSEFFLESHKTEKRVK